MSLCYSPLPQLTAIGLLLPRYAPTPTSPQTGCPDPRVATGRRQAPAAAATSVASPTTEVAQRRLRMWAVKVPRPQAAAAMGVVAVGAATHLLAQRTASASAKRAHFVTSECTSTPRRAPRPIDATNRAA